MRAVRAEQDVLAPENPVTIMVLQSTFKEDVSHDSGRSLDREIPVLPARNDLHYIFRIAVIICNAAKIG